LILEEEEEEEEEDISERFCYSNSKNKKLIKW